MRVHCKNCDAVIDVRADYTDDDSWRWIGWWHTIAKCYHCNSTRTTRTDEPYRLPKWTRPNYGVKLTA
jgi:hypothetical protein